MAVRDAGATLEKAVCSICMQTCPNWELLLIDDGSTDETAAVAGSFRDERIRFLSDGKWIGQSERLNQAIALSRGRYLARMDGDDVCYPERFAKQVQFLEENREVDLLGTQMMVFRGEGIPVGKRDAPERHEMICKRPTGGFRMFHPTFMGRIEWFRKHEYAGKVLKTQDQELLLRSYRTGAFANLPEILLGYREDHLNLHKILSSRKEFTQSLLREFNARKRWDLSIAALAEQMAKGMLDVIAVGTGLNYHLLRHRAGSASEEEKAHWRALWETLASEKHGQENI